MEVAQKLKIELPHDPVISFLAIYTENPKTQIRKYTSTPLFITALLQ